MLLAPAIVGDGFGVARTYHHHHFALRVKHVLAERGHGVSNREGEIEGVLAGLIVDVVRRLAAKHRHRALLTREAALNMQRIPRALFFILGNAVGVFARMAERGLVGHTRNRAANVGKNQLDGAADRGVGAIALAEHVGAAVHAEREAGRAVYHHQRRRQVGRTLHAVQIKRRVGHRLDRRDDDRHVLGQATRHHAVDGNLFDRRLAPARRNLGDQGGGGQRGAGQHRRDPRLGRRHHRQAVSPALVMAKLERIDRT